jgi:DNA repair exonuclease SbcCD nuclease subunit
MIRILWRTDVHCCDQTPSSRTDDWPETVLGKLGEVGEIARAHGCDAVLDGGDFWNDKTPIRTSHRMVTRVAAVHGRYPCPVYANVGNHDVRLGQLDNLAESPLETLFASGVFRRLYDEHELVLERDGVKVRVVGVPYHGPRYDLDRFRRIERRDEDWLVCVAHVLASPQGGEMFKNEDILRYSDLPALMPGVDVMMFGHWHKDQGITPIGDGKIVVNVGSLTRGSLTQDNLERIPGVVVLGFWPKSTGIPPALEFVPLRVRKAAEVFDIDKRAQEELRASMIDTFVESVKRELHSSSQRPYAEILGDMEVPSQVKERALAYIEGGGRDRRG